MMQFETFRPYGYAVKRDLRQPAASTFDYDAIAERLAQGLPPVPGLTKSEDGHWIRNSKPAPKLVTSSKPAPKSKTDAAKAHVTRAEYLRLLRAS